MFIAILMSTSCNKRLKHAIAIARDNSSELKVVLKHFESDPNPLKYKAAKFLIENMPSQFQIEGNTVDIIDSIYVRTGNVSLNVPSTSKTQCKVSSPTILMPHMTSQQ